MMYIIIIMKTVIFPRLSYQSFLIYDFHEHLMFTVNLFDVDHNNVLARHYLTKEYLIEIAFCRLSEFLWGHM